MKAAASLGICVIALILSSCVRRVSSTYLPAPSASRAANTRVGTLPPAMQRQVLNAVDAGDGDIRARELRRRMTENPDNLEVRLQLAGYYEQSGYPELAAEHYRLALGRFPDSAEVVGRLIRCLRSQGAGREAATTLESFLAGYPQSTPNLLSWLGILKDELGLLAEAEKAHRAALALDSSEDYLYNNLGYNLLLQGRRPEAETVFRQALQLNRNSAIARNNLALSLVSKPEEALLHWESTGDLATAHNNLAVQYMSQGKLKEARQELEIALKYRQDLPEVIHNLGIVSELDGEPVTLSMPQRQRFWQRFASGMKKAFVASGPEDVTRAASGGVGSRGTRKGASYNAAAPDPLFHGGQGAANR